MILEKKILISEIYNYDLLYFPPLSYSSFFSFYSFLENSEEEEEKGKKLQKGNLGVKSASDHNYLFSNFYLFYDITLWLIILDFRPGLRQHLQLILEELQRFPCKLSHIWILLLIRCLVQVVHRDLIVQPAGN